MSPRAGASRSVSTANTAISGSWVLIALIALAVVGFYLPWVNNPAAALSANAYDLAEWVGLSPVQRGANPPMIGPFFLRLPLALLAALLALQARGVQTRAAKGLLIGAGLALALTLQPPLGFFRGVSGDPNYRQLFALSVGTALAIGGLLIAARTGRGQAWRFVEALLALALVGSAGIGYAEAMTVLRGLGIPAPPGVGIALTGLSMGGYVVAQGVAFTRERRGRDEMPSPPAPSPTARERGW